MPAWAFSCFNHNPLINHYPGNGESVRKPSAFQIQAFWIHFVTISNYLSTISNRFGPIWNLLGFILNHSGNRGVE